MLEIWTKEEEVRRLQERFDRLKAEQKIGQAKFARDFTMPGGASMITQHLKSTRPINLEHATVYAKGFGCRLAEISPRLAKQIADSNSAGVTAPERFVTEAKNEALISNLQDWRLKASSKSVEVIDQLTLLAQKNRLRDEDWLLIEQITHRFMNR